LSRQARPNLRSVADAKLSAVDLVTAEIRRSILSGDLPPGQSFAVTDMTSQLGMSHIPVREALQRLEAQGLVVLSPARRPMVAPLSLDDVEAIYQLRLKLEAPLAGRMAELRDSPIAGAEWSEELRRLIGLAFNADVHPDDQWDAHYAFHRLLVEPAATAWELRFLQQIWDAADRYTRLVFDPQGIRDAAERERRAAAHHEVLRFVLSGTATEAEAALHKHFTDNLRAIRELLDRALNPKPEPGNPAE
jgi:DNA-binding GntR family transcriptional regulator